MMEVQEAVTASLEYEEIDIFLFSNGQQNSPPRKYHLGIEDFQWWDATLCTLARSQYGSLDSSIQLYSLDGNEVESPSELKDNLAYVAVVPPDSFISAGYEKYLMKASRSWEKRQSKRTGIEDCKPDGTEKDVQTLDQDITLDNVVLLNRVSNVQPQTRESPQKPSPKPVSPRLAEKLQPGAKQVSQLPISRKSNFMPAPVELITKKAVINKREPAKNNVTVSRQSTAGRSSIVNSGGFAGQSKSSSLPIYNVPHKVDDRNIAFKGRINSNVTKIEEAINNIKLPIRKKSDQVNLIKKIEERSKIQTPLSKRSSRPINDEHNRIKIKGITNIKKSFTIPQTPLPKKHTTAEMATKATENIRSLIKDLEEIIALEATPVTKNNDIDVKTTVDKTKIPIPNDAILTSTKNAAKNQTLNMFDQLLLSKPTSNDQIRHYLPPRLVYNKSTVDLLPHIDGNNIQDYRSPSKPVRNDKTDYDLLPFDDENQIHDSSTNPTVNDNKEKLPSKSSFSKHEDEVFLPKSVSKSKLYDPLTHTPNELTSNITDFNNKDSPLKLTNKFTKSLLSPDAGVNDNKPLKLLPAITESVKNYDSLHKTDDYDLLPNTTGNTKDYKMPSEPEDNANKVKNNNLLSNSNGNNIDEIELYSVHAKISSKNSPVISSKNGSPCSVIPPSKNIDLVLPLKQTDEKTIFQSKLTDSGKVVLLVRSDNERIDIKTMTLENNNQAEYNDSTSNIKNNNSSLKNDTVINDTTADSQQIVTLVRNKNYIITKPENENDTTKHPLVTIYTPTNASHNVEHSLIEETKKIEIYESVETITFKNAVQDKKDEIYHFHGYKNSESEAVSSYVDAEDTQDKRSNTRRREPVKMLDIDSSNDFVNSESIKVKKDHQNSSMVPTDGLTVPLLQSRTQPVALQSIVIKKDIIEPIKIFGIDSSHAFADDERSSEVKESLTKDLKAFNYDPNSNRASIDGPKVPTKLRIPPPVQLQSIVIKNDIIAPVKICGIDSSNDFCNDQRSSKVKEGIIKDLEAFNGYQNPNMVSTDGLKEPLPQSSTSPVPSQSIVVKNGIFEGNTDQFIAVVQKGDVINLKLNIEIKNSTGVFKNIQTVDTRKSRSSNNSKKDENNDDGLTQNKSLQSIDSECPPHLCCRKGQQIIVYRCPCCNQCASRDTPFRMVTRPVNDDMQPYYVLLPVMKQENITCLKPCVCSKQQDSCKTFEKKSQNTESLTNINMISSVRETVTAVAVDETVDTNEYSSKRQVAIVGEENIRTKVVMASASQTSRPRDIETTQKFVQTDSNILEMTTQTDWCDVLLEARLHPDNHYTFHLPSIEILRQYNLLQNQ